MARIINSTVGEYVKIGNGLCLNQTHISSNTTIEKEWQVLIGINVTIYENVKILGSGVIKSNSIIGAESVLEGQNSIGWNSILEPFVYLGEYVRIGSNVLVKERAIIEKYAMVKDEEVIDYATVVISPPDLHFFRNTAASVYQTKPSE